MAALSAGAVEWSMLVEADGATNKVTLADKRYAIDVSIVERDGAWSGSIANREKGAIVLRPGLPAGAYTVKVKATAAGNAKYKSAAKSAKVKVRVRNR